MTIRPLPQRYTNESASSIQSRRPKTFVGALSGPGFRIAQELCHMSSNPRENGRWRLQTFDRSGNLTFPWKVCRCAGRRRGSASSMSQVSSFSTERNQNLIEHSREKVASMNSCIFTFHTIRSGTGVTFRM
jgi:hypothetical protein